MAEGISIGGRPAETHHAPCGGDPQQNRALQRWSDLTAYGEGLLCPRRADARGKASAPVPSRASASVLLLGLTVGALAMARALPTPPAALAARASGRFPAVCR